MNSFRFIERGINAEIARQEALLRSGEQVVQETLHFDPRTEAITSLRSKEEAHDYRYFPEPDLVPVAMSEEMLAAARDAMPELPAAREERLRGLGINAASARQLAWRTELGDYFEAALLAAGATAGTVAPRRSRWPTGSATSSSRASATRIPTPRRSVPTRWPSSSRSSAPRR